MNVNALMQSKHTIFMGSTESGPGIQIVQKTVSLKSVLNHIYIYFFFIYKIQKLKCSELS